LKERATVSGLAAPGNLESAIPIKVAYDISNLGAYFDRYDAMHGINRVVDEVLNEICNRDDLEITAVALDGEDPIVDCIKASLYLENRKPPVNCKFNYTFHVGPALTKTYRAVFRATQSAPLDRLPFHSPRALSLRLLRAALYRMAYQYRVVSPKRVFDHKRFHVYHCPHLGLPPKDLTGDLPRVVTVYDLIPLTRPDFVSKNQTLVCQALVDGIDMETDSVICISEFTRTEFCETTGMSPERVMVVPLAAAHFFRPVTDPAVIAATRERYHVPGGEYLLCLAAPQPRKNLAHLIRSFFRLLDEQRLPNIYLVLAGSREQGWMYDEVLAAAESSSTHSSRLIFTGYVADQDLPALYSGAVAFVFPSLYEGFGLPALEAMACGTPVITSNTTSLPEVVGDAALSVDPTDADKLCEAMCTILSDHSLREELSRKGLMRAAEFSWKRCAELTANVYHVAARQG
jgi:glycosyltransferase involved in cell wall biosynthesis